MAFAVGHLRLSVLCIARSIPPQSMGIGAHVLSDREVEVQAHSQSYVVEPSFELYGYETCSLIS